MTEHAELFQAVKLAAEKMGDKIVSQAILKAHMGNPSMIRDLDIPMAPLRRYRNSVSGDPARLIADARQA